MINVLHIVDKLTIRGSNIHGVTKLLSLYIPLFNKEKYNVFLCNLRSRDKGVEYLEQHEIEVTSFDRGKFDVRTLLDIMRIIKRKDVHIVHLHGYGSTTFGRVAALLLRIPCVVQEHIYDKAIPWYQKCADKLLAHFTTCGIAVSESVKEFMVMYRAIRADKVKVIYNGILKEHFADSVTDNAMHDSMRVRLHIPPNNKIVAIIGRLDRIKGHYYFLKAARIILKEYHDVTFLIVGDGDLMHELREQASSLHVESNVVFVGHCNEIPRLLKEVDIKVVASLSEGLPISLIEAMTAGCAIVTTDVGGIGEIIDDGVTGFLVPPKNEYAFAEKIVCLLRDDELRKNLADNAKKASEQYDIRTTVKRIESCYEEIISKA